MIRLTVERARRMVTLWAAARTLKRAPRNPLYRALRGLAAEARLVLGNAKIGTRRWV